MSENSNKVFAAVARVLSRMTQHVINYVEQHGGHFFKQKQLPGPSGVCTLDDLWSARQRAEVIYNSNSKHQDM